MSASTFENVLLQNLPLLPEEYLSPKEYKILQHLNQQLKKEFKNQSFSLVWILQRIRWIEHNAFTITLSPKRNDFLSKLPTQMAPIIAELGDFFQEKIQQNGVKKVKFDKDSVAQSIFESLWTQDQDVLKLKLQVHSLEQDQNEICTMLETLEKKLQQREEEKTQVNLTPLPSSSSMEVRNPEEEFDHFLLQIQEATRVFDQS